MAPVTYILGPAKRVVGLATISIPTRSIITDDAYTKDLANYLRGGRFRIWDDSLPHKEVRIGAEDNTFTLLDMGNGCLGVIISNFIMPHGLRRPMPEAEVEIYGDEGGMIVGGVKGSPLSVFTMKRDSKYRVPARKQGVDWFSYKTMPPAQNQLVHFVDSITNDKDPLPNVEWGRHVSEIMIKSLESARTGRALEIESTFE